MLVSMQTMHRYKRQRLRQRKRKRGTEREHKKTHEKQEYKNSLASRVAPSADQTESSDSQKKTLRPSRKSLHPAKERNTSADNMLILAFSKEIEHPHDLKEHLKFCVKIDMQLAVSTRPHNIHQLGIGGFHGDKNQREKEKE